MTLVLGASRILHGSVTKQSWNKYNLTSVHRQKWTSTDCSMTQQCHSLSMTAQAQDYNPHFRHTISPCTPWLRGLVSSFILECYEFSTLNISERPRLCRNFYTHDLKLTNITPNSDPVVTGASAKMKMFHFNKARDLNVTKLELDELFNCQICFRTNQTFCRKLIRWQYFKRWNCNIRQKRYLNV